MQLLLLCDSNVVRGTVAVHEAYEELTGDAGIEPYNETPLTAHPAVVPPKVMLEDADGAGYAAGIATETGVEHTNDGGAEAVPRSFSPLHSEQAFTSTGKPIGTVAAIRSTRPRSHWASILITVGSLRQS
ncbi:MAG TPA: hypothetical protein VGI10_15350 [Polyangiaceae bacterium]